MTTETTLKTAVQDYYTQRITTDLGISPEINNIGIWQNIAGKDVLVDTPIFTAGNDGIDILVYDLDNYKTTYGKNGSRHKITDYKITRLLEPVVKPNGDVMKYRMPKNVPTMPFFAPCLLLKFKNKTSIKTLYLTEGYFKAFKACMHGIDCIGLPSITCMKEKATGTLHTDIKRLIDICNVERIVWLVDGDCRDITSKDITDTTDLAKRPNMFYSTVVTFTDLLSSYDNIKKYFAHINTYNIEN
jgi:hypothetical protein